MNIFICLLLDAAAAAAAVCGAWGSVPPPKAIYINVTMEKREPT